jgi:hypothetical protein
MKALAEEEHRPMGTYTYSEGVIEKAKKMFIKRIATCAAGCSPN